MLPMLEGTWQIVSRCSRREKPCLLLVLPAGRDCGRGNHGNTEFGVVSIFLKHSLNCPVPCSLSSVCRETSLISYVDVTYVRISKTTVRSFRRFAEKGEGRNRMVGSERSAAILGVSMSPSSRDLMEGQIV